MTLNNKILPVALVAALFGGSVGALVMRDKTPQPETRVAAASLLPTAQTADGSQAPALRYNDVIPASNAVNETRTGQNAQNLSGDDACYRAGFNDGFAAARNERNDSERNVSRSSAAPTRVVYRNAPVARSYRSSRASSRASRTAYYDYQQQPRGRSFWSKHRDKLTVAGGAGVGALIGGLAGGKKGALIGAAAGGGGGAIYTYGIRKRSRRY